MITVPPDTDVHMSVDADDTVMLVNWLTSCGTMHDFDLHASYIHVQPDDPQSGELVLEAARRLRRRGVERLADRRAVTTA